MHDHAVYEGLVRHHRFKPVKHKLCYKVFSFLVDVDKIDDLDKELKWFSRNKFNFFSFYDQDHGSDKPDNISKWIRAQLQEAGFPADGKIQFLFYPRMFGYAFNPLSVFYCYDKEGKLSSVLYAVRNTFGGRHGYLIPITEQQRLAHQRTDKLFHVSPFIEMNMDYHFILKQPDETLSVTIKVNDPEGPLLNANFSAERKSVSDESLKNLFFRFPMMTLKVMAGIHWEAIKLILKGLRLRAGDPDPEIAITIVR